VFLDVTLDLICSSGAIFGKNSVLKGNLRPRICPEEPIQRAHSIAKSYSFLEFRRQLIFMRRLSISLPSIDLLIYLSDFFLSVTSWKADPEPVHPPELERLDICPWEIPD